MKFNLNFVFTSSHRKYKKFQKNHKLQLNRSHKKKKKLTNSVRIHFILTKFDKIFTITKYENPVSLPRERNET